MSVPTDDFFSGVPIPVEPELIERELSRLWKPARPGETGDSSATRACLSNLVFYIPCETSRRQAQEMIPLISRRFPSRMFLLTHGTTDAASGGLSAAITAVCHASPAGKLPVCCEQITLEAPAGSVDVFPGAVVPLLVPDLPLVLVLLAQGGETLIELLGNLVDRVVTDSRSQPIESLRLLAEFKGGGCANVDDLAWGAILPWRRVFRDLFEEETVRKMGDALSEIRVSYQRAGSHEQGGAVPAALLAGWLISRLGWEPLEAPAFSSESGTCFRRGDRQLRVELCPETREASVPGGILEVELLAELQGEGSRLRVDGAQNAAFRIDLSTQQSCILPRRIPYYAESDAAILGTALQRGTQQDVFREAAKVALALPSAISTREHRPADRSSPGGTPSEDRRSEARHFESCVKVLIYKSADGVIDRAAKSLIDVCRALPERKISLALAGGSTPANLYRTLATKYRSAIPWERMEVFFGDERAVPPSDPESNYRMALETLLAEVPLPREQVHRMIAESGDLPQAAIAYEQEIRRHVPPGPGGIPAFDLIWLGLGTDGHTASLFPKTHALGEDIGLVALGEAPPDGKPRMTMTFPLLNAAHRIQFLVVGRAKARAVRDVLGDDAAPADSHEEQEILPAACVQPADGLLEWLLDREAAEEIQDPGLLA